MRVTAFPVTGCSPRGRLHVGTSRVPDALFELSGLVRDRAPLPPPLLRLFPPLAGAAELPRGVALPPLDPLAEDEPPDAERGVAFCPSFALALFRSLKRCDGAASRAPANEPKPELGVLTAPALEPPLLLDVVALPPPDEVVAAALPPPRETAVSPPPLLPGLLRAPLPPPGSLTFGFCASAGTADASVNPVITSPSANVRTFISPPPGGNPWQYA